MPGNAKPNIVIIMADELRDDVVRHLYPIRTPMPNLDRLRQDGVTFANCFCQTPTCCPSRGSFVTGKYPHQLGLWNHRCVLPAEERTLGHHLSAHGYDAVAFGKTHGMCPGFRSVTYDLRTTMASANHGYRVTDADCVGVYEGPEDAYCDFVACRQFDEYLGGHDGRPFVSHIGIYAPHPPLYPPRRFAELHDWRAMGLPPAWPEEAGGKPRKQATPRGHWEALSDEGRRKVIAAVLGMSTLVDTCVGRVVESLRRHRQWDNTVLVFTSDHGDLMGAHGLLGKFYNHYEEALRVPMILRVPDDRQRGRQLDQLIEMIDVYPTLCELAGVPMPFPPHTPAGRSVVPLLAGEGAAARDCVFSQIEHAYMVRTTEWKLVVHTDDVSELYHLATDPGERENLYGRPETGAVERDLLRRIVQVLGTHRREGFNIGRNAYFG